MKKGYRLKSKLPRSNELNINFWNVLAVLARPNSVAECAEIFIKIAEKVVFALLDLTALCAFPAHYYPKRNMREAVKRHFVCFVVSGHGFGIPRSLQIFCTNWSIISLCRGTLDTFFALRLT